MSISSATSKVTYAGNGANTQFSFSLKVFQQSDVLVVLADASGTETTQTLNTHYTVNLNGDQNSSPGGLVTMLTAPASGATVVIARKVLNTQGITLTDGGLFYPSVIEGALDRVTIQVQQLQEKVDRAVTVKISDTSTSTDGLATEIANAAVNAASASASASSASASASSASASASSASASASSASASASSASSSASSAAGYLAPVTATSTSSLAIGTGSKTFTTQSGKSFVAGHPVRIVSAANPTTNYMTGTVTSYSSTTLVVSVAATGGSGTYADWVISIASSNISTATATSFTPTGNIAATDVQNALAELDTEKQAASANLTSWSGKTAPSGTVVGTTDTQTLTNKTISGGAFSGGYTESVNAANTSTAYSIDLSTGSVQKLTLTGNCTYTFPTATAGASFLLVQAQDATGSRTVTWPASVKWPGGAAPAITATASKADLYAFTGDGTYWYGRTVGKNY